MAHRIGRLMPCYAWFRLCQEKRNLVSLFFSGFRAARRAFAQTPPKVTVAYSAVSPIFAGVWMAKEIGAFEKQGLKSDLVYISSGSITVQAMVGGNLDMSIAASNAVVSSILRGAPLVAVGSITNRPAMSLFVQPEITKPEQLQGKTLAITRHGSSTHFLTLFALEKLGLHDKVKIQPMGGTREVDAAIRTGMVAGAVRSMKPGPKTRMLVDLPDLGIPFSMDLIAVKRDFYKNSPRTVEAMLKAYIEGVAALKTRKESAYKVLGKYMLGANESLDEAYEYAVKYLDRQAKSRSGRDSNRPELGKQRRHSGQRVFRQFGRRSDYQRGIRRAVVQVDRWRLS